MLPMRLFVSALFLLLLADAQAAEVDLTRLPLGDNRHSTEPKRGYIWPCRIDKDAGGAFRDGPWIRSDGTFDFTRKAVVDGSVMWPSRFTMSREGNRRVFTANDLPAHPTGKFPIQASDDAYQYDRNPNSIREQSMRVSLPADPQLASAASCAPGAVGILVTGAVLFNALDAPGRDAVAHETQDGCQGHPQSSGVYHYHSVTTCIQEEATGAHSALVGYALDGFGIFGRRGEDGEELSSADLDECHGHTHAIDWDGKEVTMYHYHATWDFPYSIGCMRGRVNFEDVRTISGPPPGGMNGPRPDGAGRGPPPPPPPRGW
jgi:hypothetical protein